ncbi:DoxX family protein [Sphingobacterium endophyticum]|uniref:DoxX family protein n=1 Tax=Sphingobacterium endophyticum TaxID=2546448 RepID=UPI0012E1E21C|nr:DoxX family protein [Sphingobacterium endophyticum]
MKRDRIIFWISTTIIFLFEGVMPLAAFIFSPDSFNAGTKPLGYPDYFAYGLIVCKVLGSTALIVPKLNPRIVEWAYAGLIFNLIFASFSHLMVDRIMGYVLFPIIILAILSVSYIFRIKIRNHGKDQFQNN